MSALTLHDEGMLDFSIDTRLLLQVISTDNVDGDTASSEPRADDTPSTLGDAAAASSALTHHPEPYRVAQELELPAAGSVPPGSLCSWPASLSQDPHQYYQHQTEEYTLNMAAAAAAAAVAAAAAAAAVAAAALLASASGFSPNPPPCAGPLPGGQQPMQAAQPLPAVVGESPVRAADAPAAAPAAAEPTPRTGITARARAGAPAAVLPPTVQEVQQPLGRGAARRWRVACRRIATQLSSKAHGFGPAVSQVGQLLLALTNDAQLADRVLPSKFMKLNRGSARVRFFVTKGRPENSRLDTSSPKASPAAHMVEEGVYLATHYTKRCMMCRKPWRRHTADEKPTHSYWQIKVFTLTYTNKSDVPAHKSTYNLPGVGIGAPDSERFIHLWVPKSPHVVAWYVQPCRSTAGNPAGGGALLHAVAGGGKGGARGVEAVGDSGSEDFDPSGEEDEGEGRAAAAGGGHPSAHPGDEAVTQRTIGHTCAASGALEVQQATCAGGAGSSWPVTEGAAAQIRRPGAKHQRVEAPGEAEEQQEAARIKQPCVEAPWEADRRLVFGFLGGCCEPQRYGSDVQLLATWRELLERVGVRHLLAMRLANGQCLAHWLATPPTHLDDSVQPPPPPPADPDAPLREEVAVGMVQATIDVLGLRRWRQLLGVWDQLNGATPLHRAGRYGHRVRVFELMLRYASRKSLTCFSNQGFMAYHNAFRCGHSRAGMAHLSALLSLAHEVQSQQSATLLDAGGAGSAQEPLDDGLPVGFAWQDQLSDDEAAPPPQPLPLLVYSLSNKFFQGHDAQGRPVLEATPPCGHARLIEACAKLDVQSEPHVLSKEPWSILRHGRQLGELAAGWLRRLDLDAPRGEGRQGEGDMARHA